MVRLLGRLLRGLAVIVERLLFGVGAWVVLVVGIYLWNYGYEGPLALTLLVVLLALAWRYGERRSAPWACCCSRGWLSRRASACASSCAIPCRSGPRRPQDGPRRP